MLLRFYFRPVWNVRAFIYVIYAVLNLSRLYKFIYLQNNIFDASN